KGCDATFSANSEKVRIRMQLDVRRSWADDRTVSSDNPSSCACRSMRSMTRNTPAGVRLRSKQIRTVITAATTYRIEPPFNDRGSGLSLRLRPPPLMPPKAGGGLSNPTATASAPVRPGTPPTDAPSSFRLLVDLLVPAPAAVQRRQREADYGVIRPLKN